MSVSILNTDSNISGKTVAFAENTQTVTGAWTYDRDPSAPFAVTAGSAVVTNLDADKVDGQEGSYYLSPVNHTKLKWAQGRLTLTTATPVTTSDVTGAGTIYYTPYGGNLLSLYSGTEWVTFAFSELSLALTATSGKPYDVFIYSNSGTPTLETLVWTNDTTRATALTLQDGVLVKTGATTRRYVGTFYASGSNTTEDSEAKRYLFNYYNQVPRSLRVNEATNTWTYTTATWQQARATATNQVDVMIGVAEQQIKVMVSATVVHSAGNTEANIAVGLDGITAPATGSYPGVCNTRTVPVSFQAHYNGITAVGRHYFTWMEQAQASGTATWYGDNGGTTYQSGISGTFYA